MDRPYCFQDVVRCHLCDTPHPSLHCDICGQYLCETCKEEHLTDIYKEHEVLPFIGRECSPKCKKHSSKICERYCVQCAIPICVECVSSKEHRGHEFLNKNDFLRRELQELETEIFPDNQEIACNISEEIAELKKIYQKLTTAIDNHEKDLHREIDTVVIKLKSNLNEMESQCIAKLKSQEIKITQKISRIKQIINYLKNLIKLNDDSRVSAYNSRNAEFRRVPPKLIISSPKFTPKKIKKEQIFQQFGSLSAFSIKEEKRTCKQFGSLSIKTKDHGTKLDSPGAYSSVVSRPLIAVSGIIGEIKTKYGLYNELRSVSCLNDENIWTCGNNNILELYNLQGELVKSIETKSGKKPKDIAVTRGGDLIYTDDNDRTVNFVKNTQIEAMIRLRDWMPTNVCCTVSGDLLVVMVSDHDNQTRVVRYSCSTEKQIIQYNEKGQLLYTSYGDKFISENRNKDICVSDCSAQAIVVVRQEGTFRFTYSGPPSTSKESFKPHGIATDSLSRILVADSGTIRTIHILDQGGQFLCFVNNCHLNWPCGLCVDTKDNLFVAESLHEKKVAVFLMDTQVTQHT